MNDSDNIKKHPGPVNGFVRPVRVPGSNYWYDGKRQWTAKEINEEFGPIRTRYGLMYAKDADEELGYVLPGEKKPHEREDDE